MQLSAVLNIFIVRKTYLKSIYTNDLKRIFFSQNVHSYRSSLFNLPYVIIRTEIAISVLSVMS